MKKLKEFSCIYFILNKSDLWNYKNKYSIRIPLIDKFSNLILRNQENKRVIIKDWARKIVEDWKRQNNPRLARKIELLLHSNKKSKDIIILKELLKEVILDGE